MFVNKTRISCYNENSLHLGWYFHWYNHGGFGALTKNQVIVNKVIVNNLK